MTIKESRKIIAVMMAAYPNYKPIDTELAAKTWADVMEEYTYEQVDMALRLYVKSDISGFAPAPGQIIDKIYNLTNPTELNEMEAWSLVQKAICNSAYNSVEEFKKLPSLVQKAVGLPDSLRQWAMVEDLNKEVVMSNFQRAYKIELQRAKELQKMPQPVKDMIAKVNQNSYSDQIEQKRKQMIESSNERKIGEIKALEDKIEGVLPPTEKLEKCYEELTRK